MNLNDAVKKAIEDHPKVKEDFGKNPNAANCLVGVVRKMGCMADPKEIKKCIYQELGEKFEEKEKSEEPIQKFPEPRHWKCIETGQKISRDFGIINKCPNMKDDDKKYNLNEYDWDVYYSNYGPPPYGTHKLKWVEFLEKHVFFNGRKEFKITPEEFIDNNYHNKE